MGVVSVTIRAHRHLVVYPLVPVTTHRTAPSLCCCTYFLFFRKEQRFSIVQNLTTNYSSLLKSVSGQFLDSAQSQRHSVRSTRRQANFCPFLVFLVDYFYFFYAGDSLRCPRCFLPPVTTSSKKSPRKSHTDTPASFTVFNTVRKTAAVSVSSPSPSPSSLP